jgi:hypothetical protein
VKIGQSAGVAWCLHEPVRPCRLQVSLSQYVPGLRALQPPPWLVLGHIRVWSHRGYLFVAHTSVQVGASGESAVCQSRMVAEWIAKRCHVLGCMLPVNAVMIRCLESACWTVLGCKNVVLVWMSQVESTRLQVSPRQDLFACLSRHERVWIYVPVAVLSMPVGWLHACRAVAAVVSRLYRWWCLVTYCNNALLFVRVARSAVCQSKEHSLIWLGGVCASPVMAYLRANNV